MSDTKLLILAIAGAVTLIVGLASVASCADEHNGREACRTFCEDFGETAYYSPEYGCFCVTSDGHRYNPDTLTKDGAP
jgi:hypothetical protein